MKDTVIVVTSRLHSLTVEGGAATPLLAPKPTALRCSGPLPLRGVSKSSGIPAADAMRLRLSGAILMSRRDTIGPVQNCPNPNGEVSLPNA